VEILVEVEVEVVVKGEVKQHDRLGALVAEAFVSAMVCLSGMLKDMVDSVQWSVIEQE
jgi:hypothetical protein